jgi:3-isopropylmalate/(R)-2-methylmalate dehydratase small subunit
MISYVGIAFKFGDDINTDYIISSRRKKDTLNPDELTPYIMEDIRPGFNRELKKVNIIVAGENFGCGSAMEVAAQIMKSAGVPVILAKSFARSYYRNAINNGILLVELNTDSFSEGDLIKIKMDYKFITVENLNTGMSYTKPAFEDQLQEILTHGGLVEYIKEKNRVAERRGNNGCKD